MTTMHTPSSEHFDVLIVGAGLSGVAAGWRLQERCPGKRYAILEARERSGGTWDLFRYPGVRSDSDIYTLGYPFRPWTGAATIADGAAILAYLRDAASESGVDRRIRLQHRVQRASWSSQEARWTVDVERGPQREQLRFTCGFLLMCTGYYDYNEGYTPQFAGVERYRGRIVHPQQWTEDVEYAGKRVIVIGSGATAVTLAPQLAKQAAHVTMLQRSPSYIVSLPAEERSVRFLRRWSSPALAHRVTRWKYILLSAVFYRLCKRWPALGRALLLAGVRRRLGPDFDVERHFSPRYNPWEQRVCVAADGDLFTALKNGSVAIVTDHIDAFTATGLKLRGGAELAADLIVVATGLKLLALGGVQLSVDGRDVELSKTLTYKGMMCSDVPNLAWAFGYANASWTLKCDLTCEYVCRLLNYMDERGLRQCTPRCTDSSIERLPLIDFSSGYVRRARGFPMQGSKRPWRLRQSYPLDFAALKFAALDDAVLEFAGPAARR